MKSCQCNWNTGGCVQDVVWVVSHTRWSCSDPPQYTIIIYHHLSYTQCQVNNHRHVAQCILHRTSSCYVSSHIQCIYMYHAVQPMYVDIPTTLTTRGTRNVCKFSIQKHSFMYIELSGVQKVWRYKETEPYTPRNSYIHVFLAKQFKTTVPPGQKQVHIKEQSNHSNKVDREQTNTIHSYT